MLRRFATLVLLVPLAFNGLWMVCAGEAAFPEPEKSSVASEATPHCNTICPTQKPPETGAICLLSANGEGTSLAAFAFALAAPPVVVNVSATFTWGEWISEPPAFYLNPPLSGLTPPPRA